MHDDLTIGVTHIPVQSRPVSAGELPKVVNEAVYFEGKFDRNRRARKDHAHGCPGSHDDRGSRPRGRIWRISAATVLGRT